MRSILPTGGADSNYKLFILVHKTFPAEPLAVPCLANPRLVNFELGHVLRSANETGTVPVVSPKRNRSAVQHPSFGCQQACAGVNRRHDRTHDKAIGEFSCIGPVPALAAAVVRRKRVRGVDLRDRLVPVVATGGWFLCGFIGCVAGDVYGWHV